MHVQQIGTGEHAVRYLARYVYRVALTNHSLERFADGRVTFRYTHARTGQTRRLTLPVDVFLGRFLQHVLPRGFPKIRSYGLLSPSRRAELDHARTLLRQHAAAVLPNDSPRDSAPLVSAESPPAPSCPVCQRGHLVYLRRLPPECHSRAPP